MIKVQLPNMLMGISFSHPVKREAMTSIPLFDAIPTMQVRYTHCELYEILPGPDNEKPQTKLMCEGIARCSPLDNFNKEAGRKIALTRAIKVLELNRDEREVVWETYLNR